MGGHASAWTLLLIQLIVSVAADAPGALAHTCKPMDLLQTPKPADMAPQYRAGGLPVCRYECSCCDRNDVAAVFRSLASGYDDPGFSRTCLDVTTALACRVCDPEFGTGAVTTVCPELCDTWWRACKGEYFGFEPRTERLVPCAAEGTASMAVCSRLDELAHDGPSLCEAAGIKVAPAGLLSSGPSSKCFSARMPSAALMTQYCDMSKAPSHLRTAGAGGGKSAPRGAQRSGEGGSKKSSSWDDWQPSKSQMMVAYVLMFAVVAAVPRIIRGYVAHKHAPELREFDRLQALHAVQQRMMKANLRATLQAAQSNKPSAGTAAAAAASSPAAAAAKAAATSQPVAGQSPATTPPAQPAATGTAARPDRDKTE